MSVSYIWFAMILISIVSALLSGRADILGAAAFEGAAAAVELGISICGVTCLWTGVGELMRQNGMAAGLAALLRPALGRLFPAARRIPEAMEAIAANVGANMLGLGNAATPAGVRAAELLASRPGSGDELCMLVVLNTASIQLIPSTIAAVRAGAGAAAPFDILPAVWLTSAASVAAGLGCASLLKRLWR